VNDRTSVLLIAHGHPRISKGGAETVAYTLFEEYRRRGLDVTFLARIDGPAHGGSVFSTLGSDRELLFHSAMHDYFTFRALEARLIWKDFRDVLLRLRPSIVHFHHYLHLGLELIHEVRRTLPDAKIVLTLHEYLLLCHHYGQMVKSNTHQLCYRSSPEECARCFPERSPGDFFLRERYIKTMLSDVDGFIAPSQFLADRYRAWGLAPERVHFVEYGHAQSDVLPPRELAAGEGRGRFAYFGQINPFKGLLVLLEAFGRLSPSDRARVHLDIHGANLGGQTEAFQGAFERALGATNDCVDFQGPYEAHELPRLMAATDWVIVPSTWWENSPVVIDEARSLGRPILCSNIGGMAERVGDGQDGHHFPVGDASALRDLVARLSIGTEAWDRIAKRIRPPTDIRDTAEQQLKIYREAL
jgi:glycosyltransferase involved in cell wall biosynthesis